MVRSFGLIFLLLAAPAVARGQAGLSQDQALRLAFPAPLAIERHTAFLADSDLIAVRALAPDVIIDQRVVSYYLARDPKNPVGVAYFDSHRVRSMQEVVMVVVGLDDRVSRVEILSFAEPPEYRASGAWLNQFKGKQLNDQLSLRSGIANLTGASLTSRALVQAVRRVLALHQRIHPFTPARPQ